MNTHPLGDPVDVTTVTRDDTLLDALGHGNPAAAGDDMAVMTVMLVAWRADLAADPLPHTDLPPVVMITGRSRLSRGRRRLIAAAAVVVGLVGAATVAASTAGPNSPLWPITTMVYAERADSLTAQRDAQRAIAGARAATGNARYADASRLLDEATVHIGRIRDRSVARRLLDEVAALRGLLPGTITPTPVPPSTSAGTPTPAQGAPPPGADPGSGAGAPTPSPSTREPILPLPTLPLPPLPLPTISPAHPRIAQLTIVDLGTAARSPRA